jgi:hypothetical protein
VPLFNSVAVCSERTSTIDPVLLNWRVPGLKSSAERLSALSVLPPVISTWPLGKRVSV